MSIQALFVQLHGSYRCQMKPKSSRYVLKLIGLVRYFPAKIKKSVKNSKNDEKMLIFWQFFKVFSGLGEK